MIRLFIWLVIAVAVVWCGATVKLGKRTFFQHVSAVWSTPAAQEMKDGIEEKAGPVVDKLERGAKAGYHEATRNDEGSGSGSGTAATIPSPHAVTGTH